MERICISLPEDLYQKILADAKRFGISISAAARYAISQYYKAQNQAKTEKGGDHRKHRTT